MSYELDAMHAQMNRLERQLRILKIAASSLQCCRAHGAAPGRV